jgi:spoIIIJ-associated protein
MNAPENAEWRTVIRFAEDEVLRPMLRGLGIPALIEIRHRDEGTILSLEHPTESGRLIGRDGHTLAAIQYLVNLLVNKRFGTTRAVLIDCAGYRGRLKAHLEKLAKESAREAQRTGEPITLEPMVAADRRVVHTALRDWPGVRTVSVDEDPESGMKRVQIVSVGEPAPGGPRAAETTPSDDEDDENSAADAEHCRLNADRYAEQEQQLFHFECYFIA